MASLVAGGAGFIGSHLCKRLLAEDDHVICIDNLHTGRRRNIATLLERAAFTFIEQDILEELPPLPRLDRVFHLASPASPPAYQRYPVETLQVNSEGTRRLLRLAARDGARFLFASTSEIYGDPLEHPQRESYRGNVNPIGPRSMYDEAKRFGEALTVAYHETHGVDTCIARIFNTYGPCMDPADGRVVSNFINQAIRGEPITVYGDGSQTRSFQYVDDLVEGLLRLASTSQSEPVNLGNPKEYTVLQLARLVLELVGSTAPIVFEPLPGDDPRRRRPDISLAQRLLGWTPTVSLREGLERSIAYYRMIDDEGRQLNGAYSRRALHGRSSGPMPEASEAPYSPDPAPLAGTPSPANARLQIDVSVDSTVGLAWNGSR
jgi:dTDP-glucose 4,6-dehydratase